MKELGLQGEMLLAEKQLASMGLLWAMPVAWQAPGWMQLASLLARLLWVQMFLKWV